MFSDASGTCMPLRSPFSVWMVYRSTPFLSGHFSTHACLRACLRACERASVRTRLRLCACLRVWAARLISHMYYFGELPRSLRADVHPSRQLFLTDEDYVR